MSNKLDSRAVTPIRIVAECPVTKVKLVRQEPGGWSTRQEEDVTEVEVDAPAFDDSTVLVLITRTRVDHDSIRRDVEEATRTQAAGLTEKPTEDQIMQAVEAQMAQLDPAEFVLTINTLPNISADGLKELQKRLRDMVPTWPR